MKEKKLNIAQFSLNLLNQLRRLDSTNSNCTCMSDKNLFGFSQSAILN